MRRTCPAALAALAWLCLPTHAAAQGLPDLAESVVRGGQVDQAIDEAVRAGTSGTQSGDSEIDGEAGIYVLQVNDIFRVSGTAGLGYTDNPRRIFDPADGSAFAEASASGGLFTRLGGAVDFTLAGTVSGREFFDDPAASSRSVSGTASLGVGVIGPIYLSMTGFGGWSYDDDFENAVGFYGATASASAVLPVTRRMALRPGVGVNRQWSDIAENRSITASASLEAFYQISSTVSASARGTASRRWFDDFYEDVTFVARRDWNYAASASLAWRPAERVTVGATVGYEKQDSTFFLSEYEAYETAAAISLSIGF